MDAFWVAVAGALAGAIVGSFGVWLTARLRDRERDAMAQGKALQDKVHQLEIRIVKMERDLDFYLTAGTRRIQEGLDA